MSAPTVYTEKMLGDYMAAVLGSLASILSLAVGATDAGSFSEAVNATLLVYGVTNISQATDVLKLRALARAEAWQLALDRLSALYDFVEPGGEYTRSQMHAQAEQSLQAARTDALAYDPGYVVSVTRQDLVNDPYRYRTDDERTL